MSGTVVLHGRSTPRTSGFATVLVGFDGSAGAREALRWAAGESQRESSPLVVVQVVEAAGPLSELGLQRAHSDLTRDVDLALPDTPPVEVRVVLASEGVPAALVAAVGPDDLLVVGAGCISTSGHLTLGPVATSCLRLGRQVAVVVHSGLPTASA